MTVSISPLLQLCGELTGGALPAVENVTRIGRDDPYGPPSYQPEPYKPDPNKPAPTYHKGGPVYVKTFVKTDYDGNFKWGVKHNIEEGYH